MVKEMALIRRKSGLSREEFIRYYEEVYAPLMVKCCPHIKRYVRNYTVKVFIPQLAVDELDFDCITEVWYEDMEGFKAMGHFYTSEASKVIHDAEENFMDTRKIVMFLAEEKVSK